MRSWSERFTNDKIDSLYHRHVYYSNCRPEPPDTFYLEGGGGGGERFAGLQRI